MSSSTIRLVPVQADHLRELGRILHDAFGTLHDYHKIVRDFPTMDNAVMAMQFLATRPDFVGVTALETDGNGSERPIGSNFLSTADSITGVGPITVDPKVQSRGVGRALMQHVMNEAKQRGCREVRLYQECINGTSLSLYTSLGFSWVDTAAIMTPPRPAAQAESDALCRPLMTQDLQAIAVLSERGYGFSRSADAEILLNAQFPAWGLERGGRLRAYFFPSMLGHAGAESDDDLIALLVQCAGSIPEGFGKFLCPLSEVALFRTLLARGSRVLKMMNYMSWGETYQRPPGTWLPSVLC